MLVVPAHQLRDHLQSASCGISLIHRVFDSPARGALADLHRHTDLWRREKHRLAQIRLLLHLDQALAHHSAAQEFVVRGATHRQAALRLDDFDTVAQCPSPPYRAQHIPGFAPRVQAGKARR